MATLVAARLPREHFRRWAVRDKRRSGIESFSTTITVAGRGQQRQPRLGKHLKKVHRTENGPAFTQGMRGHNILVIVRRGIGSMQQRQRSGMQSPGGPTAIREVSRAGAPDLSSLAPECAQRRCTA